MKYETLFFFFFFSGKSKKNIVNLSSSADLTQRMLKVKSVSKVLEILLLLNCSRNSPVALFSFFLENLSCVSDSYRTAPR